MGTFWDSLKTLAPGTSKATDTITVDELASMMGVRLGGEPSARQLVKKAYRENLHVYSNVQQITTKAKTVPWLVQRQVGRDDLQDVAADHRVRQIMEKPNPWHAWEFIVEHLVGSLILTGDAFLLLNGPGREGGIREPREVLPLPTEWVKRDRDENTMEVRFYEIRNGSTLTKVPPEAMVDTWFWAPDNPFRGQGRVEPGAQEVDMDNEYNTWNRSLLRNLATPSGAFASDENLTEAQFKRLKKEVRNKYSGSKNAGIPMLLEAGMKWVSNAHSPKDMEWIEGRRELRRDLSVGMGVPPELAGDPEVKTYANALHARLAIYEDQVFPTLQHVARSLQMTLRQWWPDLVLSLDIDQVPAVQERRREFAGTVTELIGKGVITQNEARAMMGLEEVPGADQLLLPLGLSPAGEAGEPVQPPTEDEIEQEEEPDDEPEEEERAAWLGGNGS